MPKEFASDDERLLVIALHLLLDPVVPESVVVVVVLQRDDVFRVDRLDQRVEARLRRHREVLERRLALVYLYGARFDLDLLLDFLVLLPN